MSAYQAKHLSRFHFALRDKRHTCVTFEPQAKLILNIRTVFEPFPGRFDTLSSVTA